MTNNIIKIKHGASAPYEDQLEQYELGVYNGYLFIGGNSASSSTVCSKINAGAADKAGRWTTQRTITADLASTTTPKIDGSGDASIAVTGILPISKGGTGKTSWASNRMCWVDANSELYSGQHWVDNDSLMIGAQSKPSGFTSGIYISSGKLLLDSTASIEGASTLYIKSPASKSIVFQSGGASSAVFKVGYDGHCYITGDCKIDGSCTAGDCTVEGDCAVEGDCTIDGNCNLDGHLYFTSKSYSIQCKDKKNTTYWAFGDNSTNLWIGSEGGTGVHHTGNLCLSTGHNGESGDKAAGNPSILICVPNAANNAYTSYKAFHEGYISNNVYTKGQLSGGALFVGKKGDSAGHTWTGWGTGGTGDLQAETGRVYFQVVD